MITHPPVWFKPELVKSEKSLEDPELKELLTKPLRESKKAKKKAEEAQKVMRRIGMQLIQQLKAAIQSEKGRGVELKDITERDLLTLLIKANMATDIPDSQRLSDEDVLARASFSAIPSP